MPKPIKINQPEPPAKEVPLDVLATSIAEIAKSAKHLMNGPLRKRTLCLLIAASMPAKDRLRVSQIQVVLEAMAALETDHLKDVPT